MTTTSPATTGASAPTEPYDRAPECRARAWVPQAPDRAFADLVARPEHWNPDHRGLAGAPGAVVLEPGPDGGWFERRDDASVVQRGRVLDWAPGRRIVVGRLDDRRGRVEVTIEPDGPGSVIELAYHGPDAGGDSGERALAALVRHEAWVRDESRTAPVGSSVAEHKQTALHSLRAMSDGSLDIELAARLHTPDYRDHEAGPHATPGPLGVVAHRDWITGVYPDLRFEIQDVIGEDDKVVVRCVFTGTHLGWLFKLAPTGRRVTTPQIHILRFEGGRMAEHWAGRDHRALMSQLGQD